MGTLGFEEYVEPLKVYLLKYREVVHYFTAWKFKIEIIHFTDRRRQKSNGETESYSSKSKNSKMNMYY